MARVRVLDRRVAEKIAAGEVVERPVSVVKELVENALDAGARRITVDVEEGGKRRITVRDDGEGMSREDAILAFSRYATSKIEGEEDLERVRTYGFRGEALHSIAAVSRVELVTRSREDLVGTRVVVEGGEIIKVEDTGAPVGTTVTVRDLFFNVPARRKFMKSSAAEERRISAFITAMALARPDVHIVYLVDGREKLNIPAGSLRSRVACVFGADAAKACREVYLSTSRVSVRGCASLPEITFRTPSHVYVFVNGRVVEEPALRSAVLEGYGTLLFRDSYPLAVLNVSVPPEDVDVNVHPRKMHVVFRDPHAVYSAVRGAVRQAFETARVVPKASPGAEALAAGYVEPAQTRQERFEVDAAPRPSRPLRIEDAVRSLRVPILRIIGQVLNTYIVAEGEDSLFLIDQHAAHERIRYEEFLRAMRRGGSQALVEPVVVHLSPAERSALEENAEFLASLGFDVETLGGGAVMLRAIPPTVPGEDAEGALRDALSALTGGRGAREEAIKAVACRGAVKAGQALGEEEMLRLIKELSNCDNPFTCPHGRPTMVRVSKKEIERMFRRGV